MKNNHELLEAEKGTAQARCLRRRQTQKRQMVGMALLGTMMALMLILTIALVGIISTTGGVKKGSLGALSAADGTTLMASRRLDYYGAMNLAETGVRMTVEWMSDPATVLPTSTNTAPFYPDSTGNWFDASSTTDANTYRTVPWDNPTSGSTSNAFRVKIYPYTSNTYDTQKKFIIESVGVYNGTRQIVRAAVRQESFANYALFLDNTPDYFLVSGSNAFGGPVTLNAKDAAATGKTINILWKDGSADPTKDQIFRYKQKNALMTSASSINWNYNSATNPISPVGTAKMNHVVADGGGIQTSTTPVTMPTSSTDQSDAAYGPTKIAPVASAFYNTIPLVGTLTNIGVALPTGGGIVVNGSVDDMVFSVDPLDSTKQIIQIYQNQTIKVNGVNTAYRLRSTVSVDRTGTGGTTTLATSFTLGTGNSKWVPIPVLVQPSPTTVPNGVIYAMTPTATIGGVRGEIADNVTDATGDNIVQRNSMTIATSNQGTVKIGGSLTYHTIVTDPADPYEPVGNGDKFQSGLLGIVANNVQVSQYAYNPEATGGRVKGAELRDVKVHATVFAFNTFDAENYATRSTGLIDLLGGYIATNGGTFGQIDSTTGNMQNGFRKSNNYDDRVLDSPPPAFPNTNNSYKVTSFKRVTQTLDGIYNL